MNWIKNNWLKVINFCLIGVVISILISKVEITNDALILGFIGVLATFIVVGNYAQVGQIKSDTEKLVKELELKNKEDKAQLKLEIEKKLNKILEAQIEIEKLKVKILDTSEELIYRAGETSRMFGAFSLDKKLFKNATAHFVMAILYYQYGERNVKKIIDEMIDHIIICLSKKNWQNSKEKEQFDYDLIIEGVNTFKIDQKKKDEIILMLNERRNESLNHNN